MKYEISEYDMVKVMLKEMEDVKSRTFYTTEHNIKFIVTKQKSKKKND